MITAAIPTFARADEAGYLYSYGISDTRYDDRLVSLDAYKPLGTPHPFRVYVDALASQDSRTAGGVVPQIYADNYALGALGVQFTTPTGFRAFVQGGISTRLGSVAALHSGGDLRAGIALYREWLGTAAAGRLYGNLYTSTTYLSRYSDWVSYSQIETGRKVFKAVDLFARGTITFDSQAHYYSNLVEMTLGLRYRPFGLHGPALSVEHVAGAYLRNLDRPTDTGPIYDDFRPTITFGRNL
ncbi:MAG: hypothetical protein PVSMB8_09520 [Vulcanimicrobiaceae bacterium]